MGAGKEVILMRNGMPVQRIRTKQIRYHEKRTNSLT